MECHQSYSSHGLRLRRLSDRLRKTISLGEGQLKTTLYQSVWLAWYTNSGLLTAVVDDKLFNTYYGI